MGIGRGPLEVMIMKGEDEDYVAGGCKDLGGVGSDETCMVYHHLFLSKLFFKKCTGL